MIIYPSIYMKQEPIEELRKNVITDLSIIQKKIKKTT